ncbi:hypothetical protein ABFX02_08G049400 [Erythranthe guttata]
MASSSSSSSCNKSFCDDYLLLKPEEASFSELVKMLFSSDVGKRKFVDCPEGSREPFGRRWIMFVSVLVQKFLSATAKPMAAVGSAFEHWLNLLSENGGFFRLILKSIKGEVVHRDTASADFLSFIGNIDKRMDLDPKISREDGRYYAALSVMASKLSYENHNHIKSTVEDNWKMDYVGSYDYWNDYQQKTTTQAFLLEDQNDVVVVAFRGTESFDADAWSSDFDISWYDIPGAGKMHGGFLKALGLQKSKGWPEEQDSGKPETAYYSIRKLLKDRLDKNSKAKFIVTGHSLGGALAVLFPAILALHGETSLLDRCEGIYTFGQPRVGDHNFVEFMKATVEKHRIKYYRVVYSFDLVPRLPYDDSTLMFKHFGTCIYYNSFYKGQAMEEEPNKNYFSLIWLIPKMANACWELIRSFTISYTRGPDFREGGLLRVFRFIGLLAAGVPAHCPQDYVNATRLGSADVFQPLLVPTSNGNKVVKTQ